MSNPSTYTHFFGFSQNPFDPEPDLDSLFLVKSQREALISMVQGINERRGLISISGGAGTGKTTLLRCLRTKLAKKVKTVFISRVSLFFREILKQTTQELGLALEEETPAFLLSRLRTHLAAGLARHENVVVFVDDAQNLTKENFAEILLLSQIQEGGIRLLQIVLAGRPEMEALLGAEEGRPLNRQIQIRLQIQPLLPEESRLFIEQRLQRAGRSNAEVFTPEALELIVSQGYGIFRNIIFLCDQAFQKAFELQQSLVTPPMIRKILADTGVSALEGPEKTPELPSPDALIRRLFQNPPRLVKPGRLAEFRSRLKLHPSYPYVLGALVLGTVFYLGWELLPAPSPSKTYRIEAPAPVAKEKIPLPAAPEKGAPSPQSAPAAPPVKEAEAPASSPGKAPDSPAPPQTKPEAKIEAKPLPKTAPPPPAKAESRTESKPELLPEVRREIRLNEPVAVPKSKTLYSFARDYYQRANPTLIDYILESNPHIKDMDRVPTDQKIVIPEISEGSLLAQSPEGAWKIRLGTFDNLQAVKAYQGETLLKEKEIEFTSRRVSPSTTWYRLYAGKFDTMEEALKATRELRKKGLLPALKK